MKKYKFFSASVLIVFMAITLPAQEVYQHISNKNIYSFLDELANQKTIEINSVVKPYSRKFIADKLIEARKKEDQLSKRQKNEIDFYLLEYKLEVDSFPDYNTRFDIFKRKKYIATAINPLGVFYKDNLFTFAVKPIWGINYFFNENGNIYHRWGGAEALAYIGEHWGLYANLRDNTESQRISEPEYFTLRQGGVYKNNTSGGGDYSEMRGGITYSWKWGSIGLVKDHLVWGNNYHGTNIIADRPPSYAQVKLRMTPAKWFELNYFHGWLVSEIVDSTRSYYTSDGTYREVFHPKYIAANMLTFTPWRKLNLSIGNSIVYSDIGVHPAYLNPIMFYKSIDHTLNGAGNRSGQNAQMFFDISSRNIKHLHLYGSVFIDELKIDRLNNPEEHNFISYKAGGKVSNLLLFNYSFTIEYTRTLPMTYQHRIETTTFESNRYSMGHYLRDNSQEIFIALEIKPITGLQFKATYILAQHGDDYIYNDGEESVKKPFMENVTWQNQSFSLKSSYEFINNAYLFVEFVSSDITGEEEQIIKYTPEFFRGKTNNLSMGFNFGF